MKNLYCLGISLLILTTSFAQRSGGNHIPAHIYGKIVDASTNKGLEAASVQVVITRFDSATQANKDSIVGGMLTKANGDFSIENVPSSPNLKFYATAIGFQRAEQKISLNVAGASRQEGIAHDMGNISLKVDPKMLESVTVTGSKPLMALGIDRKVFNVEKNLASAGGTAEDVMRNVPSLSVDIDGNVTLRNSTPQIFVDGRPTTMTMEQIPADAIESVEIITNPSAKFDASGGTAGILNIVLKKNRRAGYNGTLRAGIDKRGRYNVGADINVRQNKVNVFANANYRERKSISNGKTDRLTKLDLANTQLYQTDRNVNEQANFFGRAGFDYLFDNRNTLTIAGYFSNGNSESHATNDLYIDTLFSAGTRSSYNRREPVSEGNYGNQGASIGFKHLYSRPGRSWTGDINYNGSSNDNENQITTSSYNIVGGPLSKEFRQLIQGSGTNDNLTIQTDYSDPITEKSKLEFGGRVRIRNVDNLNVISYMNEGGIFAKVPQLSSNYTNTTKVYAGYGSFSNKINKFGYQLGLRVESSEYSGTVNTASATGKDTVITYGNNFPFSLFPSIFLSQDLGNNQELQFNVTRRINRPDFWELFPFTDYSDSLNLRRGNPDLRPEFTYSAELSYQKTYSGKNTFLASAYFKYIDRLITRFQEKETNPVTGRDILINTFINANSSYIGGLELISRQSVFSWWEVVSNLNLYTSKINTGNSTIVQQGNIFSWFGKVNNTFKLPANFSIQISGEYRSKSVLSTGGGGGGGGGSQGTAQGYRRPQGEVDAGLRFEFLKEKKASITLNISDIFRTDANNVYSESLYFTQNSYRLRDPQFFRLNFSWRFGKFDTSLFRRRNNKDQEEVPEENTEVR